MTRQYKNNQSLWIQPYKLICPSVNQALLSRDRLMTLMDQCHALPLTTIVTPAGYGKSTLVANWVQQRQLAYGWYALDANDNNPDSFARHLVHALHHASGGGCPQTIELLETQEMTNLSSLLAKVMMELAQMPAPVFMVLDDLQVIKNAVILSALRQWLRLLPAQIHVILIGQQEPPLSLSGLRVKGQVLEIGATQLAFTAEETKQFLIENLNFTVSDPVADQLFRVYAGWPAALQLLTHSATSESDLLNASGRLGQSIFDIDEFLLQEVVSAQPESIQTALSALVVFEQFNEVLCRAMLPTMDAGGLLHELEARQLFIQRVNRSDGGFRFQDMFRDGLLRHLSREHPVRLKALKERAVEAFLQTEAVMDAVRMALSLDGADASVRVLESAGIDLYRQGQFQTLSLLFNRLSEEAVNKDKRLTLLYSWVLLATYREQEVLDLLTRPEHQDSTDLMAEYRVAQAQAAINREQFYSARTLAEEALRALRNDSFVSRTLAYSVMGQSALCTGDLQLAHTLMTEAERHAFEHRLLQQRLWTLCLMSDIHTARGELSRAAEVQQGAISMAHDCCIENVLHMEFLYRNRTQLLIEQGDLNQADELLRKSEGIIEPLGHYGLLNSHIHRGMMALWRGHTEQAANLAFQVNYQLQSYDYHTDWLARAQEFLLACQHSGILTFTPDFIWRAAHLTCDADNHFYQHYQRTHAIADYLSGNHHSAIQALEQLTQRADRIGLEFQSLKNRLQLVLWQPNEQGRRIWLALEPQLREFKPLMSLWLSSLFGAAPIARDWPEWHVWFGRGQLPDDTPGAHSQALEMLNTRFAAACDQVTPKELQVLLLIGAGLNNDEISASMHIAPSTVKSHIRRLYRKLDISRRAQAIEISQHL